VPIDTNLGKWFHVSMTAIKVDVVPKVTINKTISLNEDEQNSRMAFSVQLKKLWEELAKFVTVGGDLA